MNAQELASLEDDQYGLLFDVRRSVRYHDRRRGFYEKMHKLTNFMTILMAGSVLFDLAKEGNTARWLIALSVVAALLAVADMVFVYSEMAGLHDGLKRRFAALEIAIISGPAEGDAWDRYMHDRLVIEQDEPPIYKVLDGLCRNALLTAQGHKDPAQFNKFNCWQSLTRNFFRWENANTV